MNTVFFKLFKYSELAVILLSKFKLKIKIELLNLMLVRPTLCSCRILSHIAFTVNYKEKNALRRSYELSKIEPRSSKL
jgi:hypothetical protein